MELVDFPYTGERRPFDWFQEEPEIPAHESLIPPGTLGEQELYNSLVVAMLLYMADRKQNYINYMRRGKLIFQVMVPLGLKDKDPAWNSGITEWLGQRGTDSSGLVDWSPAYEIQRLWLATGIHWSWLELAWMDAERMIWDSRNKKLVKKLERVRER